MSARRVNLAVQRTGDRQVMVLVELDSSEVGLVSDLPEGEWAPSGSPVEVVIALELLARVKAAAPEAVGAVIAENVGPLVEAMTTHLENPPPGFGLFDVTNGRAVSVPCYSGRGSGLVIRPDGSPLDPAPSLALANHSPTGFAWGYLGSGPSQLALALILDRTGDPDRALALYQGFKAEVVARWPAGATWALPVAALDAWLAGGAE